MSKREEPLKCELSKKWRDESSHSPIRVATYGSKDSLEHCADELDAFLAGKVIISKDFFNRLCQIAAEASQGQWPWCTLRPSREASDRERVAPTFREWFRNSKHFDDRVWDVYAMNFASDAYAAETAVDEWIGIGRSGPKGAEWRIVKDRAAVLEALERLLATK